MKEMLKRFFVLTFAVIIIFSVCAVGVSATSASNSQQQVTVLFTHDLHSHLLPSRAEDGGEYGGYARLMTAINEAKKQYPDAVLLDGGDFSMGSLFQTCYATDAVELRIMGDMGYDVTTLGNHEFDYLPEGLASMLNVAASADEEVPEIVLANYLPHEKGEEGYNEEIHQAFENYGVKDYVILERGGVYFAVFGIFGKDSDECAPNSDMILSDSVETSKRVIDEAVTECKEKFGTEPVVVCLSHSGTSDGMGEDYELAAQVDGIDLIISAHTHTELQTPIKVNDTYIVSAYEYGKYLGIANMVFDGKNVSMNEYKLVPIDENVAYDAKIASKIDNLKSVVEKEYLAGYGISHFDETLVYNPYNFDSVDEVYATQHESTLGNLFSDAYKTAVENATGEQVDVALTATGVIRETIPEGGVTVSDVFNAASLGVGTEGELVKVYITGKELKAALEVDASVQPIMSSAQLFFSGVEYKFNTSRMIFNKVDYCMLRRADGTLEEIENDKLYCVVTGMYVGQMLGAVKDKSFGLLSITPRDKDGNPIEADELVNYVVHDENGRPVKEWFAITSYLKAMNGTMSDAYAQPDGRKTVYSSLWPWDMLRKANIFTFVALAVILVLVLIIVLVVRKIVRKIKKKRVIKSKHKDTELSE